MIFLKAFLLMVLVGFLFEMVILLTLKWIHDYEMGVIKRFLVDLKNYVRSTFSRQNVGEGGYHA